MCGVICEPYRIGKFSVGDHLAYRIWFNNELLAECSTFEECKKVADTHENRLTRTEKSA